MGETRDSAILTINAGSSSIKLAVFGCEALTQPRLTALVQRIGTPEAAAEIRLPDGARETVTLDDGARLGAGPGTGAGHATALAALLPRLDAHVDVPIVAAGHRVVHGGERFRGPLAIDDTVLASLEELIPLARTHQRHCIAAIRAVARLRPEIPQIACFDTAFHATLPSEARTFALPEPVRRAGVRRYGFHGLSYQWIADALPTVLGEQAEGRVIAAHLGNGASLCGLVGLESRATTMGFTPLDGLVMGERPGLTDPGALLFMLEEIGMGVEEVRETLLKRSGLLGLSGLSNDMRTLSASAAVEARFALAVYVHRAVREIGAIAAEIGGVDALVFTGGVGENAAAIRAEIVERLGFLGLRIDAARNAAPDRLISPDGEKPVLVLAANEEAVIARETDALLAPRPA
ncbi:MAG: acetate/propionate family kinase [Pseudomonadota bacterium]